MIEDVLNCKGRVNIIGYIVDHEWCSKGTLNHKVYGPYSKLTDHLNALVDADVLTTKTVGTHTLYGFSEGHRGKLVKQFIKQWRLLDAVSGN